jgi:hypothetical protein
MCWVVLLPYCVFCVHISNSELLKLNLKHFVRCAWVLRECFNNQAKVLSHQEGRYKCHSVDVPTVPARVRGENESNLPMRIIDTNEVIGQRLVQKSYSEI